jgi:molybdenum cofactor synthesis domain-containing protein
MKPVGSVKIEIISTGDELLFGRILDTNSNWLAKRVTEMGAILNRITIVGDDSDDISTTLNEALERNAQFIIFTGGLGPSKDDLTVESIGITLKKKTIIDTATAEKIKLIYLKRGIVDEATHKRGRRMARILEGSIPLHNPVGFAVGMMIMFHGKNIITLPGVPAEMKGMFEAHVAPMIEKLATSKFEARAVNVRMVWKDFFPLYRELQKDYPNMYIKNAATPPVEGEDREKIHTIKVHLVLKASNAMEAKNLMEAFLIDYQKRIDKVGGGEIIPIESEKLSNSTL